MANEVRVQSGLQVLKRNDANTIVMVDYQSRPISFQADMTGAVGPSPGAILALTTLTVVDLSLLTIPGFYRISSLDDDTGNYVQYGIYDPQADEFYPWGELGPGESYVGKFSRNLLEMYTNTGTGTTGTIKRVAVKAFNANAYCLLEAFEK
jgi:hypothetical protein